MMLTVTEPPPGVAPLPALDAEYERLCSTPSDINEHLPTLKRLAAECSHVTEMGMRGGISTAALLAGRPKTLISWDINPVAIISQRVMDLLGMAVAEGKTTFQPRVGNTLEILMEPTELLFIDTLHTAAQLKEELWRHVFPDHFTGKCKCKVKKYLVFHDTTTFGYIGEDGKQPGLRAAINWFQMNAFPIWQLVEDREQNNGLLVLKHV